MSLWKHYCSQALIGLDQSQSSVPLGESSPLETTLSQARAKASSPRESFADELSILTNWRRCGSTPKEIGTLPETPVIEDRLPCTSEARSCLVEIMDTAYPESYVVEWLQLANRSNTLVPPDLLPKLLTRSVSNPELRKSVMEAGGKRAHLLTAQNPSWAAFVKTDPKQTWEEGTPSARLAALQTLLVQSSADAVALVSESWKSEAAAFRAKTIELVGSYPTPEIESFLEAALSDKSQEVRANATIALARFHESGVAKRWASAASKLLVFKSPGLLSKGSLSFELPDEATLSGLKIETKPLTKGARLGEKAATLAVLIAATPISSWMELTKLNTTKLLALVERSEHSLAILSGLALSASVSANRETVKALFAQSKPFDLLIDPLDLLASLPSDIGQGIASELMESGELYPYPVKSGRNINANTLPSPWSTGLSKAALRSFAKLVRKEEVYWGAKDLLTSYAPALDLQISIKEIEAWNPSAAWSEATALLLDRLRFRKRITLSFSKNH